MKKAPPLILLVFFPGFCKFAKMNKIKIKMHHVKTELFGIESAIKVHKINKIVKGKFEENKTRYTFGN